MKLAAGNESEYTLLSLGLDHSESSMSVIIYSPSKMQRRDIHWKFEFSTFSSESAIPGRS